MAVAAMVVNPARVKRPVLARQPASGADQRGQADVMRTRDFMGDQAPQISSDLLGRAGFFGLN